MDFVPLSDAKNMSSWSWDGNHDWDFLKYWATQLGLKAPVEAGGSERPNVSDIVKAVPTTHLARSPFNLAYPPHVMRCHLCSDYQINNFTTILHKRILGAPPPPNVKNHFTFPLDILPPTFTT